MCQEVISEKKKMAAKKRKMISILNLKQNVRRSQISILHSNNIDDAVKTFCCVCDKVVPISSMNEHVKTHEKMNIKTYKQLYGDPYTQIIKLINHKCGLCFKEMLLDSSMIKKHLKNAHQIEFAVYTKKFLVQSKEESRVCIKCSECGKIFKRNIQLKAHIKKHKVSDMDNVMFRGFSANEQAKKTGRLEKMIKYMESSLRREKQAFQQLLYLTY